MFSIAVLIKDRMKKKTSWIKNVKKCEVMALASLDLGNRE